MTSFSCRENKNTIGCRRCPAEKIETGGGRFAILDFSGPDRVYHRLEMVERLTRRLLASPVTSTPGLARLALYYFFAGIFWSTQFRPEN